jgi:hypothetical protein
MRLRTTPSTACSIIKKEPKMQNLERSQTKLPAQTSGNVFAAYGESAGTTSYIVGDLLKFSKGDWLTGKDNRELADGTKLVAVMDTLAVGWQRWENQRPVEHRMGLLVDGFVPPPREELGDTDEGLWDRDDNNEARDPWQLTNYIQLVDPENKDAVYTFTTSSKGGLSAIAKLCREYGRAREKEGREEQLPLVVLSTGSYAHRDRSLGRIKFPVLTIIGWVNKADFAPVVDPINDEVSY